MSLCPKDKQVFAERGAQAVYKVVEEDEKAGLTTLFTFNAAGRSAPPMTLYWYKEGIPENILKACPENYGLGNSETGWMTTETFYEYVANIFYPWLVKEGIEFPVILYFDGHASHVTVPIVNFCQEKKIEIICLYPNSTHILQPLDTSFFHPLKELYRKTVRKWKMDNNIRRLTKQQFPSVLMNTLKAFQGMENIIINGFKGCGLVPFNPNAIDYCILKKRRRTKAAQSEDTTSESNVTTVPHQHSNEISAFKIIESHLPLSLIEEFKEVEQLDCGWIGDLKNQGLYEFWLDMKNRYGIFFTEYLVFKQSNFF